MKAAPSELKAGLNPEATIGPGDQCGRALCRFHGVASLGGYQTVCIRQLAAPMVNSFM
jgi:hypothetical protein